MELAYLGVTVTDRPAFNAFLADVIGLLPGAAPGTWRNDGKAQRLIVEGGGVDDATFLGFEVADVAEAVARVQAAGYEPVAGTDEQRAARQVTELARVDAPWGVRVEIVRGLADAATPFTAPLVPGGFLTGDLGFGHTVFATTAFEASHHFVTAGLGLAQTDWVETEIAAGIELEVRFYHCNARHHTLALARAPFDLPQRLHHLMLEVVDRDDVGRAFDRAWTAGLGIANGLGRHDNDGMFSFYVATPAGFQIEVGYGGKQVTSPWHENRRYDRISIWGHQPLHQGAS